MKSKHHPCCSHWRCSSGSYSALAAPSEPTRWLSPPPATDASASLPDRASLEQVLAEAQVEPTGQTRRFELPVQGASWELLPGDPQGADPIAADAEYVLAIGNWMVGGEMAGMDAMSMEYNYFTINGKSYPATESIDVSEGDLVRLRFINPSQTIHPMHLHGTDMAVFAKDGEPLPEAQRLNTLSIDPGETYDVVFRADNPGTWVLHCHDLHHASNNGQEPGGLLTVVNVRPPGGANSPPSDGAANPSQAPDPTMAPDMSDMPGMDH